MPSFSVSGVRSHATSNAKDMTAEDEHIVETVLIPMHADFCRKKPEAMLKDWREFRARILARTSHAG